MFYFWFFCCIYCMNYVELLYFRKYKGNEFLYIVKNVLFKLIIFFVIIGKRMKEDYVDD